MPIVFRGFSDAYGSWKIICMSRRSPRSSLPLSAVMSWPSNQILPSVGIEQPHHDARERGLAASGLADQAERLAGIDLEVHTVDRVHVADLCWIRDAAGDREVLLDALDLDERLAPSGRPRRGSIR